MKRDLDDYLVSLVCCGLVAIAIFVLTPLGIMLWKAALAR